jgi:hypothetical protein
MAKNDLEFKNSRRPARLQAPPPPEGEAAELEVWRHGDFLVVFHPEFGGSMAVDLEGGTFIQRFAGPEEIFAIIDAIYGIRLKGQKLYPTLMTEMEEADFLEETMTALSFYLGNRVAESAAQDYSQMYDAARQDLLNELIKPPKKDDR